MPDAHSNATAENFRLRWRGREEGPLPIHEIERRLGRNEIGMLHEVQLEGKWVSLRYFLEWRAAQAAAKRERQEAAERSVREGAERQAREREAQDRAALLVEEKRKNDLLAAAVETQKRSSGNTSGTSILGTVLVAIGLLMAIYFFAIFDQTVSSSTGNGRVNNLGLMQDRQVGITAGFGLVITGTLMALLGGKTKDQ